MDNASHRNLSHRNDRPAGSRPGNDDEPLPGLEPRAVSLQDYQVITRAREEFLEFLLAGTGHRE
ncbi:hypothetical protein ACIQXM_02465 [Arthrobacter sp. NPDC097144]|uniref:hypothetical protein n=1 Tax=Arthrobacter sp. NPDC097144 TaxID=3363946 RepID=UPI0038082D9E